ncbi:MAG TPA: hypothetical protein P5052_01065 [Candidatus Paceibacterota bacterium]|nr:hypothetical protein [Candidatus Paceibacterota bacterium]HRZ29371.1 hypothetical protein [Candidatus Paceibacterota bacterium]
MKNLLAMYLFRTFTISLLGLYIGSQIDNTLIKYLLLILILFLIVYYYKYLKLIIKPV